MDDGATETAGHTDVSDTPPSTPPTRDGTDERNEGRSHRDAPLG